MAPRIMFVEDDGVTALDIESILVTAGYRVVAMNGTGREAIQSARETIPDLALIDIGLKGTMDGIELAHVLREQFNLAVLFLTGYTDQRTRVRAGLAHPLGYVAKPFSEIELLSSIELALQRSRNGTEGTFVGHMGRQPAMQQPARKRSNEPS